MPEFRKENIVVFLAKLSVSLGLIIYLVWHIDWERAINAVNEAAKFPLTIAPFVFLAGLGVASFRWHLILADSRVALSCWQAYLGYLVGAFYNLFMPGVIGGDIVRIGRCVKQTKCQIGTATTTVLLERISGIIALSNIALFVYLLFPGTVLALLPVEKKWPVTVAALGGIVLILLVLFGHNALLRWVPCDKTRGVWNCFRSGLLVFSNLKRLTFGKVLILSGIFQAIDIFVTFLLSQAIGIDLPLRVFFAVIPLVYLTTILPISLGGLGVREGTLVFLLAQFGVVISDAITLSFLVYLNRVVVGSLGGAVQLINSGYGNKLARVLEKPKPVGMTDTSRAN